VNGHAGLASHGALASALGALNAAHASPTALAHAAPRSRVELIAAYDRAMLAALATATPAEIAARNAAIAAAWQNQLTAGEQGTRAWCGCARRCIAWSAAHQSNSGRHSVGR
jgi:hypothetical protein